MKRSTRPGAAAELGWQSPPPRSRRPAGPLGPAAGALGGLAGCALLVLWWLGGSAHAPRLYPVGTPPAGLEAREVTFASGSGAMLRGWVLPARGPLGVVLMHGSGGDRRSMLGRARFLQAAGYTALVFDFQGNGESPGRHATQGYLEAWDAEAAVRRLREVEGLRWVAAIGFSLGGAAALLGPRGPLAVDALVLEAVYPTIEEAVANRIRQRLGPWSGRLYPLITWQLKPRLGIGPEQLRPLDRIARVGCPVLVIAGERDQHTTLAESLRLYAAAPQPKRLWVVPGAVHEDFYRRAPEAYRRQVLDFLSEAGATDWLEYQTEAPGASATGAAWRPNRRR